MNKQRVVIGLVVLALLAVATVGVLQPEAIGLAQLKSPLATPAPRMTVEPTAPSEDWPTLGAPYTWPPLATPQGTPVVKPGETPTPAPTRQPSSAPLGSPPADQEALYYVADNAGYSELHVVGMDEQGKKQSEFRAVLDLPHENVLVGLHSSLDDKYLAAEFNLGEQDNLLLVIERASGRTWCPLGEQEKCLGHFVDWTKDNRLLFRPTPGNQLEGVVPGGALLADVDTGQYSQLDLPAHSDQAYSLATHVSLSPDDTRVAYAVTVAENDKEIAEIWTMRIDGENKQLMSKVEGVINALSWSPVGEQLAYFYRPGTATSTTDPSELWLINSDGTGSKLLANQTRDASFGHYGPTWSPNGRYIAFVQVDDSELYLSDLRRRGTNVYIVDTVTKTVIRLSEFKDRRNYLPIWSPDGKSVAFFSADNWGEQTSCSEIWVVGVDDGQLHLISETASQYGPLAWLAPLSTQKGGE